MGDRLLERHRLAVAAACHQQHGAGPAPLPLSKLFGTSKHFAIHWSDSGTEDQYAAMLSLPYPLLSASYPVKTTVHWTVRFTRRAHPPGAG